MKRRKIPYQEIDSHQLGNLVRGLLLQVCAIDDALSARLIQTNAEVADLIRGTRVSVDTLFNFATEMANQNKLAMRPSVLREATESLQRIYGNDLSRKGIELEIGVASNLVVDVPLRVVLRTIENLVSNASDAIGLGGGRIYISAEDLGSMIVCEVMDDGSGIPEEIRNRIFDPGQTTKENHNGRGLYLARHYLTRNHASIELTSPGPGGTKFTIHFPKP